MLNFTGNTILRSVEADQSIEVTDGSLTISGDVGSGASIILKNSQSSSLNQSFGNSIVVIGNNVINGSAKHELIVQGKVLDRVNITCNSDMEFRDDLSDQVTAKTFNGNIITKNLGENVTVKTHNGNIIAGDIGCNSSVKSHNGKIKVGNVSANATIKSHNGDIHAISCERSAIIETHNGKRYINGVLSETRRKNHNRTTNLHMGSNYSYSSPFGMNNLSNFFSSETTTSIVNGRIFINGVEQAVATSTSRENESENDMPAALQSYITGFKGESFQDAFKRLVVDVSAKYPFLNIVCIISKDIPNIPVSLNGHLYDWCSLKSQIETNGYKDPMTRETFTLKQVIPDRTTLSSLEGILKNEEEMHKSNIATCSSSGFKAPVKKLV